MRVLTQRRVRFSLGSRSGVLPLLFLLACAAQEVAPSAGPAQSSASVTPLPERAAAQQERLPGLIHTVPAPGASAESDAAPPAEPGVMAVHSDQAALDGAHIELDRYEGESTDGAEADGAEQEQSPTEAAPPDEPPAQEPLPDDSPPSDGAPDHPPATPVDEGSGAAGADAGPHPHESPGGASGAGGAGGGAGSGGAAGVDGSAGAPAAEDPGEEEEGEDEEGDDGEEEEEEEEPPPLKPSFHLAIIGSSTAAGEGASSASYAWVELLAGSLRGVSAFSVSNFAVGGYTSVELLPASRKSGNIEEAILEQPDLILVALAGSNDLSAGTSTATFFERLTTLRDTARAAGIPTFFLSTAPKDISEPERASLAEWAHGMQSSFQSCWVPGGAGEHASCFVDLFAVLASSSLGLLPEYSSGDGIHLNDAGHAAVFRQSEAVIRPYVCSVTSCR